MSECYMERPRKHTKGTKKIGRTYSSCISCSSWLWDFEFWIPEYGMGRVECWMIKVYNS